MGEQPAYLNPPSGPASTVARWVSYIINPVFSGIFIAAVLVFRALDDPVLATVWFSITVLLTAIPTLGYVIYLVKIGYLTDIFMPDRKRRIKPVTFIVIWTIITTVILGLVGAPLAIMLLLLATIVQVGLLLVVTLTLKVSFHSAVITAVAAVSTLLGGPLGWIVPLFIPIVGWARVYLRRHTTREVVIGCIAGAIVGTVGYYIVSLYLNI